MFLLAIPVYLIAVLGLHAGAAKLAAYLIHRTQLSWKHAFIFAAICVPIFHAAALLRFGGWPVTLLVCCGLSLLFGGRYLASQAQTQSGAAISRKTGTQLSGLALGLSILIFALLGLTVGLLLLPSISNAG
jgi:hypothetical protein